MENILRSKTTGKEERELYHRQGRLRRQWNHAQKNFK